MSARFRGHAEARMDDKGRFKLPAVFKKTLEGAFGGALFVTAWTEDYLLLFPLEVWEKVEEGLEAKPLLDQQKARFMTWVNRYGTEVEIDIQGRISLKPSQRKLIGLEDELVLIGCGNHLQLWAAERIESKEAHDALSNEELRELGI